MNSLSKEHQCRRAARDRTDKQKTPLSTSASDSGLEGDMLTILTHLETQGLIADIRQQPASIQLTKGFKTRIDFIVFEHKRQRDIAIESKGIGSEHFAMTLKLWPEFGPMPLQIWTRVKGIIRLTKEIRGGKQGG